MATNIPEDTTLLRIQNINLRRLAEITKIINSTLDIGKLLNRIMQAIKDIMQTEASSLLFYDESTNELVFKVAVGEGGDKLSEKYRTSVSEGIVGWVARTKQPIIIDDVYQDERFNPEFDKITNFKTRAVICAPLLFKGKLLGVIQGINPKHKATFNADDMDLFQLFVDQAVMAVQNAIFFEKAIEERRIQHEMTAAKKIQNEILKPFNKTFDMIEISAEGIPAREISGEYYDIFNFEDKRTGIAISDIHQRGIPGAISSSLLAGAVKAFSRNFGRAPLTFTYEMDQFIKSNPAYFSDVSFFYGLFNPEDRSFEFVNTGFAYPVILRNSTAKYLKFNTHTLGREEERIKTEPKKIRIILQSGDLLTIVTDGLLNIKNERSHQFGLKKTMSLIQEAGNDTQSVVTMLKDEALRYTGQYGKREDITMIAMRVL